ncbi:hypothetical protein BpHYR1_033931 [Brachionus plicatilis]|uniref:Uncharacterized protein n=1 Tax=Brachionus plicatilis TaxID=10195 RepID=A0A3M7QP55_BRAPC|nr:hypothetical protein BpHYR1_033931 [Brachionus plicatilis]
MPETKFMENMTLLVLLSSLNSDSIITNRNGNPLFGFKSRIRTRNSLLISVGRRPSLAGPNAAKIRRPIWQPGRRPKIWTTELAGQNKDGRPNLRPNLKRTAKFTAKLKTDGHFGGQKKSAKRKIFKYYIQISRL